jgi:Arc/MetJ-type ribon-helix-helix transcriptional regulator
MIYIYSDKMADILVHLDGSVDETLRRLVESGFFKTKAEAVRAGILELGKEYQVVKTREELMDELAVKRIDEMNKEVKSKKKRIINAKEALGKYAKYLE